MPRLEIAVETEAPLSLISTLMVLRSSAYRTALETMFEIARLSIDLSPFTDPSPERAIFTFFPRLLARNIR